MNGDRKIRRSTGDELSTSINSSFNHHSHSYSSTPNESSSYLLLNNHQEEGEVSTRLFSNDLQEIQGSTQQSTSSITNLPRRSRGVSTGSIRSVHSQMSQTSAYSQLSTDTNTTWKQSITLIRSNLKELISNRDYLIILWCFSLGLAFFNALLTLISQLLSPCDYNNEQSGILGGIFIGCGLIGAFLVGLYLDKSHAYRPVTKIGYSLAFLITVVFVLSEKRNQFLWLCIVFGIQGVIMLPLLPCSVESCVECTYPISEVYSTSFIFAGGNVLGIAITMILAKLLKDNSTRCAGNDPLSETSWALAYAYDYPPNLFILVLLFIAVVPIFAFNGKYKRFEAERKGKDKESL